MHNVDFFRLCENFTFEVQRTFFSIQNIKKCFFMAFLLKKKHIRKRSIFWQKPWTNPFGKCRFFSTLWELLFSGPKKLYVLSRLSKNVFLLLFTQKKSYKKKVDFLTKSMDEPLCKMSIFLKFFRSFLLWSKKHSLLSRISKNVSFWFCLLKKKTYEKKVRFLTKTMD